ncbi:tRNA dihydrouridine synthase [Ceratocystis pirilliformis]|uniref:tRNA-dihydrouridine(16/17) synthase [NAD(P)(+)] n=1 Tax=Ceratocystis pirilliformis TaxID=259994 RepID=A0ABR3YLK1_9PEZI
MDTIGVSKKKLHGRAFYESIGCPKYVVAPMVDQSEFAWRMLTRSYMEPEKASHVLGYTPMLHARLFSQDAKYRASHFQCLREDEPWLDGNPKLDRPLIVQFCANDPKVLLEAAKHVAPYCDAVDLNFGCPQGIAKRGHYGSFLQEDQDLIHRLVKILHENLDVPVTAKIRILETKEKTLDYAKNVLSAGASIITVHGRRREQKGHLTGLADWDYIRYLRDNLPADTVIFANGNILQHENLEDCLRITGADGVMSAEGNLSDPAIFAGIPPLDSPDKLSPEMKREYWVGVDGRGGFRLDGILRRYFDLLYCYAAEKPVPERRPLFVPGDDEAWISAFEQDALAQAQDAEDEGEPARKKRKVAPTAPMSPGSAKAAKNLPTNPNFTAVQTHLFHVLRHLVSRHTDIRDMLARCVRGDLDGYERILTAVEYKIAKGLLEYEKTKGKSWGEEVEKHIASKKAAFSGVDKLAATGENKTDEEIGVEEIGEDSPDSSIPTIRRCIRPWWIAQPIIRPLPKEALAKGSIALSKKKTKTQTQQVEKSNGTGPKQATA